MDSQTSVRLLLIVLVAIVLFVLVAYYNRNKSRLESERFSTANLSRRQKRDKIESDLDDDVDMDEEVLLKSSKYPGKNSSFHKSNTGKYLINGGEGKYAPAKFENATRMKTLEKRKAMQERRKQREEDDAGIDEGEGEEDRYGGGRFSSSSSSSSDTTAAATGGVAPFEPISDEQYRPVDAAETSAAGSATVEDAYPGERLKIDDLLPKDAANSMWAMVNPAGQGDVKDQNFITAGYLQGLNTKGQTNRNANMQLRSEPPNPRHATGIWNQSTMEPDLFRRPFEVGGV